MGLLEKAAAEALRLHHPLRSRAESAEAKVAWYQKRDRVQEILKTAEVKQLLAPSGDALMKCSDEQLTVYETALNMVPTSGGMKLGALEDGGPEQVSSRPGMSDLDRLLLAENPREWNPNGE